MQIDGFRLNWGWDSMFDFFYDCLFRFFYFWIIFVFLGCLAKFYTDSWLSPEVEQDPFDAFLNCWKSIKLVDSSVDLDWQDLESSNIWGDLREREDGKVIAKQMLFESMFEVVWNQLKVKDENWSAKFIECNIQFK